MKAKAIFAAVAAIILATSCGMLGSTAGAASTATTENGSSTGTALASLYNQYKTDGKLDLSNLSNIINLATIVNNINGLKKGVDNSSFVSGLVASSKNLVTKANATNVVNQLTDLAGINLNSITKAASNATASAAATATETAQAAISKINTASSNVTNAVSTLENIFGLLKK